MIPDTTTRCAANPVGELIDSYEIYYANDRVITLFILFTVPKTMAIIYSGCVIYLAFFLFPEQLFPRPNRLARTLFIKIRLRSHTTAVAAVTTEFRLIIH